jgi:hypothetical protein
MGFSIEQFKGRFKNDFAKAALFEVFFSNFPDLRFQASSGTLPGSSVVTDTFSNGPYRPLERAVSRSYGGAGFSFLLDNEGRCLSALNQMMDAIVDPNGFVGQGAGTGVKITHYNQTGKPVTVYTLNQAYIASISDVSLDWGNGDAIATVSCVMKFRSYSMSAFGGSGSPIASFGETGYVNKIQMPDVSPSIVDKPKRPPIGTDCTGPQVN